ncbi:uncharacterized protein LOC108041173 [Drosophila rhopaloa]|uniref:Uncharacterized protein n=1 Tax=Drosophila rhopaloa TaxID=1041015 RepID=A0ABM5J7P7_DRORH|nr:uncharacterized protein LOC108041173 [Drosophila rhopaloa]
MQLSILLLLLGWVAVVNSIGLSQLFLISSSKPISNENNDQPSAKAASRHFKQCNPIETTSGETTEQPITTITPEEATTRRLVPLPTLAPSSASSSRRLVPLPTLKPTFTLTTMQISSEEENKNVPDRSTRRLVNLPNFKPSTVGIVRGKYDGNVPSLSLRKLEILEPTSTTIPTDVNNVENGDQTSDDCEPFPEGIGSRLDAKTLKTLIKVTVG